MARLDGIVLRAHHAGMSIFRRKRGKKHTGNWIARIDGKEVNLGTKDAEEAREREKLAIRGEWPRDGAADARAAAANVAAVMDNKAPTVEVDGESGRVPQAAPEQENTPPPATESTSGQPAAASVSAADLNAAAAEATEAEREMADAVGCTVDELRAEASRALECLPDALAGAYLQLQGLLLTAGHFAFVGKRAKPPRRLVIPALPPEEPARRVLAVGAKLTLQKLDLDLTAMPWWGVVLAGITMTAAIQIKSAVAVNLEGAGSASATAAPATA